MTPPLSPLEKPLHLELANTLIKINRLVELQQVKTLTVGDTRVHVLGWPGWLVDYADLTYESGPGAVGEALEQILAGYLADQEAGRHHLAKLSGAFMLLVERQGRLVGLITSDELPNTVYWFQREGELVISDDWRDFTSAKNLDDPAVYSRSNLRWFSAKKTCAPGQTWLRGLGRLRPATIYQVAADGLTPIKAIYPLKEAGPELGEKELYEVVGRRLGAGPHTLCYSTGIDSHHLLETFKDRIDDVCTISFRAPYQDTERSMEAGAAAINCERMGLKYHHIEVDLADPKLVGYLEHATDSDPFAAHYAGSMYQLFATAEHDKIITGQNADTMQFFALTSKIGLKQFFFKSPISSQPPQARLYYRWAAAASHDRLALPKMIDRRMLMGMAPEMQRLTGPHGYWPIFYFKRIHNMTTGNTALFKNAARYFNKQVFFPYTEPLVFYVAAYFKRPLSSILEPKKHLRARYHYLRHNEIKLPFGQGLPFEQTPLFKQAAHRLAQSAPGLKRHFDSLVTQPMALAVLYTFAARALAEEHG